MPASKQCSTRCAWPTCGRHSRRLLHLPLLSRMHRTRAPVTAPATLGAERHCIASQSLYGSLCILIHPGVVRIYARLLTPVVCVNRPPLSSHGWGHESYRARLHCQPRLDLTTNSRPGLTLLARHPRTFLCAKKVLSCDTSRCSHTLAVLFGTAAILGAPAILSVHLTCRANAAAQPRVCSSEACAARFGHHHRGGGNAAH